MSITSPMYCLRYHLERLTHRLKSVGIKVKKKNHVRPKRRFRHLDDAFKKTNKNPDHLIIFSERESTTNVAFVFRFIGVEPTILVSLKTGKGDCASFDESREFSVNEFRLKTRKLLALMEGKRLQFSQFQKMITDIYVNDGKIPVSELNFEKLHADFKEVLEKNRQSLLIALEQLTYSEKNRDALMQKAAEAMDKHPDFLKLVELKERQEEIGLQMKELAQSLDNTKKTMAQEIGLIDAIYDHRAKKNAVDLLTMHINKHQDRFYRIFKKE